MVRRKLKPPHSVNSPGCSTDITVGFGAPGTLNVPKWKEAPASSEMSTWIKSLSELLKCRKGMYSEPVMPSTTTLENWRQFCGLTGFGSAAGAYMVFADHVTPPSVELPKRSWQPVF